MILILVHLRRHLVLRSHMIVKPSRIRMGSQARYRDLVIDNVLMFLPGVLKLMFGTLLFPPLGRKSMNRRPKTRC